MTVPERRDPLLMAGLFVAGIGFVLVLLTYVMFNGRPITLFSGLMLLMAGGVLALVGLLRRPT